MLGIGVGEGGNSTAHVTTWFSLLTQINSPFPSVKPVKKIFPDDVIPVAWTIVPSSFTRNALSVPTER
jgi:hypothetical protein